MPLYGMEHEDLVEVGMVGLIQSVDNFDLTRGCAFTTFAMPRIRGAMLDAVRVQRAVPWPAQNRAKLIRQSVATLEETLGRPATRVELDAAIGTEAICFLHRITNWVGTRISFEGMREDFDDQPASEIASTHPDDDVAGTIERRDEVTQLRRAVTQLSERDQVLLDLVYCRGLQLQEIAPILGVGASRVSQLHTRALERLRAILAAPETAIPETRQSHQTVRRAVTARANSAVPANVLSFVRRDAAIPAAAQRNDRRSSHSPRKLATVSQIACAAGSRESVSL